MGKLRVEFDVLIDRENENPDSSTLAEGTHVTVDLNELADCKYGEVRNLKISFKDEPAEAVEESEEVIVGGNSIAEEVEIINAKKAPKKKKTTILRRK